MPSELPESIGPYRVRELLGRAGGSAVFAATNPQGRPAAVKLFPARLGEDPAAVEQFRNELAAIALLSRHPNLVHILETGLDGSRPYLAMELVDGTSLDRVLKQRRVSLLEALTVMRGVCRGLSHAHQHGVVHRSLTPRNVLVSSDFSVVKVADLGATGFESTEAANLSATLSTGAIRLGALYYLAPEVVDGRQSLDARADLYSAGVIFHEMLTGRSPGPKFGLPSQLNPELPQEIDAMVLRCLARRPDERYASAAELLAEIERLEEDLRLRVLAEIRGISHAGSRLLGGTKSESGGKKTLLYLGITIVVIALAVVGYLVLR
jgi:eukaryotic-like serine/threonine-protein kinase